MSRRHTSTTPETLPHPHRALGVCGRAKVLTCQAELTMEARPEMTKYLTTGVNCEAEVACRPPLHVIHDELDRLVEDMMSGNGNPFTKSYAEGLVFAAAVLENPWQPSIPTTKARMMARYEERHS